MSKHLIDQHVFEVVQSSYAANVLYVLTKAGIFDRLLQGPASAADLAAELGLDLPMTRDLLSFAYAMQYLKLAGDVYAIGRRALPLTEKSGSWLRAYLMVWGEQLNPAFLQLGAQLAEGANAFARVHGKPIWEFYAGNPEQNAVFAEHMDCVTTQMHLPAIARELDLDGVQRLLDVGGGTGSLVCKLAERHPGLRADLCDQPANRTRAEARIAAQGMQERCAFIGANIFDRVPPGYELYTIKHVLHDWDDANAIAILGRIAQALEPDARLVIIEGVLDRSFEEAGAPAYLHARNIEQQVWTPGRVRTLEAFEALCAAAGLRIGQVTHSAIFDISYLSCTRVG